MLRRRFIFTSTLLLIGLHFSLSDFSGYKVVFLRSVYPLMPNLKEPE
jgi:hypothetical protein